MKSNFTSKPGFAILVVLCCFFAAVKSVQAQAYLSIQGVLTKSDGTAVDDNTYDLKFILWKSSSGTSASDKVWEETVQDVETIGGVYSVVLGNNGTALTAPFNQVYYLGVSIGNGQELTPRPLLTHSPYALSLIGQTNAFPSIGQVKADWISAKSGTPGTGGYSFQSGGDTDGGLFSTSDGNVSIYTNGAERLKATPTQVVIPNSLTVNDQLTVENAATINDNLNVNGWVYPSASGGYGFKNGSGTNVSTMGITYYNNGSGNGININTSNVDNPGRLVLQPSGVYLGLPIPFFDGGNMQVNTSSGLIGYDNSSRRYKENITTLSDDFSLILKSQPKIYTRPGIPGVWELGYIAEEMDSIGLHKLVSRKADGQIDGFNYEKMILYVTEVLKTQDAAIKELQRQNTAFQAEITALKSAGAHTGATASATQDARQIEMERKLDEMGKRLQAMEATLSKR